MEDEERMNEAMRDRRDEEENDEQKKPAEGRVRIRTDRRFSDDVLPGHGKVQHGERHGRISQERIRQEVQPYLELHRREKLRCGVCHGKTWRKSVQRQDEHALT